MTNIIPTEFFVVPLLTLLLSFFLPRLILSLLFFCFNKIIKASKKVNKASMIFSIGAWLFPLIFIMQSNFSESIAFYILQCFICCTVVSISIYFLFAENGKNEIE